MGVVESTLPIEVRCEERIEHWVTEASSPVDMLRIGWSSSALKPGDEITIDVMPSKNGTTVGRIRQVTLSDGTVLKATTRYGI
jgi:hypothetical protein